MTDFEILGVPDGSDLGVVSKAYRRLAMKYHPDRNPSPDAQNKFIEIKKAYERIISGQTTASKSPKKDFFSDKSDAELKATLAELKKKILHREINMISDLVIQYVDDYKFDDLHRIYARVYYDVIDILKEVKKDQILFYVKGIYDTYANRK